MNINKTARNFMIAFVLIIQVAFLALIFKKHYDTDNITALLSIFIITVIVLFGHRHLDLHDEEHAYEKISVVIWAPVGALICHLLHLYTDFGAVLSAGIIGTLASFIPSLNSQSQYLKQLPPVIYCGVFVGMSSSSVTPSLILVVSAGVFAGVFLLLSKSLFVGIGGRLGTLAFLGVVVASLIKLFS
mgnify:CR=1 FL=1